MGIPIDANTGNLSGSVPQMLQFENGFLPAQATTEVDYRANLASSPLTRDHNTAVPGSELLNQSNFSANPVAGAPAVAKIIGNGATLLRDAAAVLTGSQSLAALNSAGGTLVLNGTSITINAGVNTTAVQAAINGAGTGISATLDGSNDLILTGLDASTNITGARSPRAAMRSTCSISPSSGCSTAVSRPHARPPQGGGRGAYGRIGRPRAGHGFERNRHTCGSGIGESRHPLAARAATPQPAHTRPWAEVIELS